jgi:hypothetical protein
MPLKLDWRRGIFLSKNSASLSLPPLSEPPSAADWARQPRADGVGLRLRTGTLSCPSSPSEDCQDRGRPRRRTGPGWPRPGRHAKGDGPLAADGHSTGRRQGQRGRCSLFLHSMGCRQGPSPPPSPLSVYLSLHGLTGPVRRQDHMAKMANGRVWGWLPAAESEYVSEASGVR